MTDPPERIGRQIEAVLDILAPPLYGERCPIFEWGHETTPTDHEMLELARQLVDAVNSADRAGS